MKAKPMYFLPIMAFAIILAFCKKSDSSADTATTTTDSISASLIVSTPAATGSCGSESGVAKVVCLAQAFKATLNATQSAALQLDYSKTNAVKWSNYPQAGTNPPRVGINLGSLTTTAQIAAFKALMSAVADLNVSNEGFHELQGLLVADDNLRTSTGNTSTFGAGNYYLAFLGAPSTTGLWELQYGGHHYAFANTYNGGNVIGVTPSFRGVEPMSAMTAGGQTFQPMEQERQAFASLISGLSDTEQTTAKLSSTFSDVLLGPGKDNQFPATKEGLRVGSLSADKKTLVLNAIKLYVNDLNATTAAAVMAKYTAELDNTYIAYAGSGAMSTQTDYARIDGPGVWIEYSAQGSRDFPGTTHPHSVWRDRTTDYGGQ